MGNKPVKWIRLTLPVYSRAAIETVSTKKKYTNNLFVFLFLLYIFRLLLGPFAAALIQTTERQLMKTTVHNRARVCVCMWARASRAIQRFRVAWCSGESMSYRTASVSVNLVNNPDRNRTRGDDHNHLLVNQKKIYWKIIRQRREVAGVLIG